MVYNPKRKSFQYSSPYTIPYDILNQAAMRYVMQFRCLPLFQDTMANPEYRSPLIDLYAKYQFDLDRMHREESRKQMQQHVSRTALLAQHQRDKQLANQKLVPDVFVPPEKSINSFYKMRPLQEEWNESSRIARNPTQP
jgi:hypothetical protein